MAGVNDATGKSICFGGIGCFTGMLAGAAVNTGIAARAEKQIAKSPLFTTYVDKSNRILWDCVPKSTLDTVPKDLLSKAEGKYTWLMIVGAVVGAGIGIYAASRANHKEQNPEENMKQYDA